MPLLTASATFVSMQHHHYTTVAKAITYLREHYQDQPSLADLAQQLHFSKYHLQRIFQEYAGVSPKQFLRFTTAAYAKEQLAAGASTLATAHQVGLSGQGRLHDLFVSLEGMSPGEWRQRADGTTIRYQVVASAFGPALVAETDRGICRLEFLEEDANPEKLLLQEFPKSILKYEEGIHLKKVGKFLDGEWSARSGRIPISLKGTPFQLNVWRALLQIPEGAFRTYSDVAQATGNVKAVRAVGTAIGKNPVALLIPCHRVIRTTGALSGYRWGEERKSIINGFEAGKVSSHGL